MRRDGVDTGGPGFELGAALAIGCALVLCAWPGFDAAIRFPDSAEYLAWPAPVKPDGLTRLGPRLPGYPLFLMVFGTGAALVHAQVWLSLACFGWLGWVLARVPGMALLGLLSLAPQIRIWSLSVLTEALSAGLFAFLVAIGVLVLVRRAWLGVGLFCLALPLFGLLRPGNALWLPFLLVPFSALAHDFTALRPPAAGLRATWPRFAAAAALALAVFALGYGLTERSGFWRMNYTTALMERVITDADARAYFAARGMPTPVDFGSEEFGAWFEAEGRSTYQGWVAGRAASYAIAWQWLRPAGQGDAIWQRYIEPKGPAPVDSPLAGVAEWLFEASAPPQWLWLLVLCAAIAVAWRAGQDGRAIAISLLALGLGTYIQVFVAYHASAAEEVRHTFGASLGYRFAFVMAAFALALRGLPAADHGWRASLLGRALRPPHPGVATRL